MELCGQEFRRPLLLAGSIFVVLSSTASFLEVFCKHAQLRSAQVLILNAGSE